jgi:hypothetical protein
MDLNLLKNTQLFADLEEKEIAAIGEICSEQSFKFGQKISTKVIPEIDCTSYQKAKCASPEMCQAPAKKLSPS